jgi:surfactin synthase thioesterase subunit
LQDLCRPANYREKTDIDSATVDTKETRRRACVITVLGFPFAGGHAKSYRPLELVLPSHVRLVVPELPGRGTRVREPALRRLPALVKDLGPAVEGAARTGRWALFGHSFGSRLAWLVALEVGRRALPPPERLIVSGAVPPGRPSVAPRHPLPDDEFITMLEQLGSISVDLVEEPELLEFSLQVLRADFEAEELHDFGAATVDIPIDALGGRTDPEAPLDELAGWGERTTALFTIHAFDGGHFFVLDRAREVAHLLGRLLPP